LNFNICDLTHIHLYRIFIYSDGAAAEEAKEEEKEEEEMDMGGGMDMFGGDEGEAGGGDY
jgi:hypothetical protein